MTDTQPDARPLTVPLPIEPSSIEDILKKIIQQGDVVVLVDTAQKLGKQLGAEDLAKTQIRSIFGVARRIQANYSKLKDPTDLIWRDFVLLKPKLAYQAGRKPELETLSAWLTIGIDLVERDHTSFVYFMDFFEAVLAYHIANGAKQKKNGTINYDQ